jgi:hypothetical protein
MDEELKQKRELQMEMNRREMERTSLDTIRVYNPLDVKFTFKYDGYTHSVNAKSEKDFPRYLARHFFKKICDYMIGLQVTLKGEELKALREKQLGKSFLDKYEENIEIWNRTPRMDDPDLVKQMRDTVILGLVEEYGYDEVPEPEESIKKVDFRSMHDQIFSEQDKRVSQTPSSAPKRPLKSKLAEEVTNE